MTPKENYLRMLRGEMPEFIPSYLVPATGMWEEDFLTPNRAPNGPIKTALGVTYVGTAENNYGAMPKPGEIIVEDITDWRKYINLPDLSGFDWEKYYKDKLKNIDREQLCVSAGGGDYFLTLVSLVGFMDALIDINEEPEAVKELLEYVSDFYIMILKQQLKYVKPDYYVLMDDDSAYTNPLFSVETYREFFKPLQKRHTDLLNEEGIIINRHDCGKSEQFIDDWLDLGVRGWNPCQVSNDLKGIKKKYQGRLALEGCWDSQGDIGRGELSEKETLDGLFEYVDTFAPGGGFGFNARIGGIQTDPNVIAKQEIVKKFYFDYAKDWYKTHK